MLASVFLIIFSGPKRPLGLTLLAAPSSNVLQYIDPNTQIMTPKDKVIILLPQKTPDQNEDKYPINNPEIALSRYYENNGVTRVEPMKLTVDDLGQNHGLVGFSNIEMGLIRHELFVIERIGEEQRQQLIYGNGNLFDAGHKLKTLEDRLHAAYEQLDKGISALVDRIRISSKDEMPRYLELYLAVTGDNCLELVRNMIGKDDKKEELIHLCEKIGERVGIMAASHSPHEDCHSGNFLLGLDKEVVAIDFRRIAEAQLHPLTNFVEKLLIVFAKKLAKDKAESSAVQDAAKIYICCLQSFLKKATTNPDEIDHVWGFLQVGPESQRNEIIKNFLDVVKSHIPDGR